MSDPDRHQDADESALEPEQRAPDGLAPWQKVVGIIGLVVLLVVLILLFAGGHTPPVQHGSNGIWL